MSISPENKQRNRINIILPLSLTQDTAYRDDTTFVKPDGRKAIRVAYLEPASPDPGRSPAIQRTVAYGRMAKFVTDSMELLPSLEFSDEDRAFFQNQSYTHVLTHAGQFYLEEIRKAKTNNRLNGQTHRKLKKLLDHLRLTKTDMKNCHVTITAKAPSLGRWALDMLSGNSSNIIAAQSWPDVCDRLLKPETK